MPARLSANGGDNVIQLISMIFQHAVARAAFDGVTDPIGARDGDLLEVFLMQLHNLISQYEENNRHASNQAQREFQAQIERSREHWVTLLCMAKLAVLLDTKALLSIVTGTAPFFRMHIPLAVDCSC